MHRTSYLHAPSPSLVPRSKGSHEADAAAGGCARHHQVQCLLACTAAVRWASMQAGVLVNLQVGVLTERCAQQVCRPDDSPEYLVMS